MNPIEIAATSPARLRIPEVLSTGGIVVLRQSDEIKQFRAALSQEVERQHPGAADELSGFYQRKEIPSLMTLLALARTTKKVRTDRFASLCLAPLIWDFGFGSPVRLDGGIPRVVVPSHVLAAAKQSGQFASEYFTRIRADGATEVFMPKPANIHRDYNRQHYLLQCNMWFPLHDAGENEVVRIWDKAYHEPVFDMDATEENFRRLGQPLRYTLQFGDAVLFHGEHLHTSPQPQEGLRRHSYDLRIASNCLDDTRHYRDLFLDLRNLSTKNTSVPELLASYRGSAADDCALRSVLEIEQRDDLDEAGCRRLSDLFDHFTFAEDRYLIFAAKVAREYPQTATRLLRTIVENSGNCFWLAKAGQMLIEAGDQAGATLALRKAYDLAGQQTTLPNFMPVEYSNAPTQLLPASIRKLCAATLSSMDL
jgi:hypothetical protein